jgi:PaREP6 domain containing protein
MSDKFYEEKEKWARELRRKEADWDFINSQSPKIKAALIFYIETGDMRGAAKIAGMSIDQFNELRIKANIPSVTY